MKIWDNFKNSAGYNTIKCLTKEFNFRYKYALLNVCLFQIINEYEKNKNEDDLLSDFEQLMRFCCNLICYDKNEKLIDISVMFIMTIKNFISKESVGKIVSILAKIADENFETGYPVYLMLNILVPLKCFDDDDKLNIEKALKKFYEE